MNKFYEEICLLEQPFVKEATLTVEQLVKTKIAKLGENITVARFVRFKVGETWRSNQAKPAANDQAATRPIRHARLPTHPAEVERRSSGGRRPRSASMPSA